MQKHGVFPGDVDTRFTKAEFSAFARYVEACEARDQALTQPRAAPDG